MRSDLLLIAFVIVGAAFAEQTFKEWKSQQSKNNTETKERKTESEAEKVYKKNVAAIKKHNSNPNATYTQEINDDADKTNEDLAFRCGSIEDDEELEIPQFPKKVKGKIPNSLSYVNKMSKVKSQGKCGSCWSFAAVSVLEYWSNVKETNQTYSEQNLVDCDTRSFACEGGSALSAFEYVQKNGISNGQKYKYVAKTQQCQRSKYPSIYKLKNVCGYKLYGDEKQLQSMLVNYGPLAVAMDATNAEGFNFYKSGVYRSSKCSKSETNHAVTLVGYGNDPKAGDFWLVRNSWGESWGEKGYFRIARGSNMCGIARKAYGSC